MGKFLEEEEQEDKEEKYEDSLKRCRDKVMFLLCKIYAILAKESK